MAKKRKRASADAGAAPEEPSAKAGRTEPDAASSKRANVGKYVLKSSLQVPFLLVSNKEFVVDAPTPGEGDWKETLAVCDEIVKQWEASSAVILADFEGEMPGFEGRLSTAAFQRTFTVDAAGLRPMSVGRGSREMGLFIDLRCAESKRLVRRIMESPAILKLIWGADGDITSLRYCPPTKPLGIECASVVDVQLGYSPPNRRLGMATMLQRIPTTLVAGLPGKDVVAFDERHARNQRATNTPLEAVFANYAVDDLHRLEAILRSQKPKVGTYGPARNDTAAFCSLLYNNPVGVAGPKLKYMGGMLQGMSGTKRALCAVRIKRHLMGLRMLKVLNGEEGDFAEIEKAADEVLADTEVSIPEDLSFGS